MALLLARLWEGRPAAGVQKPFDCGVRRGVGSKPRVGAGRVRLGTTEAVIGASLAGVLYVLGVGVSSPDSSERPSRGLFKMLRGEAKLRSLVLERSCGRGASPSMLVNSTLSLRMMRFHSRAC
jgi:hypothetical protein